MSMDFIYDEEAVYQEADIFQAEEIARGNYLARLERQGICTHSHTIGLSASGEIYYPVQIGLVGEQRSCSGCGIIFENDREWLDARRDI